MVRWILVWTFLIGCGFGSTAAALTADDYITAGRAKMFKGPVSGLAEAYDIFDAGVNDETCPDCAGNRELTFLHAVTRTIMLFVDYDDSVVPGSFFELAEEFGVTFVGDTIEDFNAVLPLDEYGCYHLPPDADPERIRETLYDSVLPQVDGIIAELDRISDSPTAFAVYFTPSETGLMANLEVDYGEVLVLKGLLLAYKAVLEAQIPYDLNVDIDQAVLDSYLADSTLCPGEFGDANLAALFDVADPCNPTINQDFLQKYPYLLMVLPTPSDANDGAAILAQARDDLIDAIAYWLEAIDYINSENDPPGTDPQDDELLYLDPNALTYIEPIQERLTTLRDSLQDRTAGNYTVETAMTYDVYDASATFLGELVLVYDFTGRHGHDGRFTMDDGTILAVEWVGISPTNTIDIELHSETPWLEAWFEGTISASRDSIADGTLHYWGDTSGTVRAVSGGRTDSRAWSVTLDPNPLFGASPPVHPRNVLPQFDEDNEIIPGTFGHGLGDDPTLSGVTPQWYQEDWSELLEIPTRVYRLWSPTKQRHFYTIITRERDKLIDRYPHVWTFEEVAYHAYVTDCEPGLAPVYRFWSDTRSGHFYTISESERDKLIDDYSHVWTYEGEAFYAYPLGQQPPGAIPVWRFWSDGLGTHFYTIRDGEKNKLVDDYSHVWTSEGIVWYVDN